jgi:hypothetical protein
MTRRVPTRSETVMASTEIAATTSRPDPTAAHQPRVLTALTVELRGDQVITTVVGMGHSQAGDAAAAVPERIVPRRAEYGRPAQYGAHAMYGEASSSTAAVAPKRGFLTRLFARSSRQDRADG